MIVRKRKKTHHPNGAKSSSVIINAEVKNMVDSWVDMELKQSRVCLG